MEVMLKYPFILLYISLCLPACKEQTKPVPHPEENRIVNHEDSWTGEQLTSKGFEIFKTDPEQAIPYFEKAAQKHIQKGESSKAAIAFANISGTYDKNLNNTRQALIYSTKALVIWSDLNDQIQMANQLKDLGWYYADNGMLNEGKAKLNEAISYFTHKNVHNGIAECKLNLAKIAFKERNFDLAEKYYLESNDIWNKAGMKTKAFTNNLFALRLYYHSNQKDKLQELFNKTLELKEQIVMRPHFEKAFTQTLLEVELLQE